MNTQETRAERALASLAKEHRGMSASADVAAAIDIGREAIAEWREYLGHADAMNTADNDWTIEAARLKAQECLVRVRVLLTRAQGEG